MGEDENPLKQALKTFAGVGGKDQIAETRAQDPAEADVQDVPVPETTVPSAEAIEDEGVIEEPSSKVARRGEEQ